jgi:hypothetical protein
VAQIISKAHGDSAEDFIARIVTELVVDSFEAIEVNAKNSELFAPSLGSRQRLLQPIFSHRSVGQASETVMTRLVEETFVHAPVVASQ